MLLLTLLAQVAFGVANPAQRFSAVPAPAVTSDPCGERGPVGQWVKMSTEGAPPSIHNWSWVDSISAWKGRRLVVAVLQNGTWSGKAFDPCGNAWTPIADATKLVLDEPWPSIGHDRPYQPRGDGSYDMFEQVTIWDGRRKAWVAIEAARAPSPRAHYAVAFTGSKLLVWGGWAKSGVLGDGAVLDVARKTWKKMSSAGAPSPRIAPTAVAWTGSRFIVWGGREATKPPQVQRTLGDGALYDPTTDRWTAISTQDAPSPRNGAIVAWTGRKLVVVGGAAASGEVPPDNGVFNPMTNTWLRLGPPPAGVELPKGNVGPLTRIMIAPDGRVVFVPDGASQIVLLDADRASWSTLPAAELGKRNSFRAFLMGRRLIVWDGMTVIAEHICPPPVPGQPICDSFAETASHNDGWIMLLPMAEP